VKKTKEVILNIIKLGVLFFGITRVFRGFELLASEDDFYLGTTLILFWGIVVIGLIYFERKKKKKQEEKERIAYWGE